MDFFKTKIGKSGVLNGMTDYHSHILWGVDDGIRTQEECLATLHLLEEVGVAELWCTPHIMEETPNCTEKLKERFELLKGAYTGPIGLHLAAENMLDGLFKERLQQGDLLRHEGEYLLVETSYYNPPMKMRDTLQEILKAGFRPLLAHPERYVYMDDSDYEELKDMGVDFQLNLPSLGGAYGREPEQKALKLLKDGYYSKMGMDIHSLNFLRFVLDSKISKKVANLLERVK